MSPASVSERNGLNSSPSRFFSRYSCTVPVVSCSSGRAAAEHARTCGCAHERACGCELQRKRRCAHGGSAHSAEPPPGASVQRTRAHAVAAGRMAAAAAPAS
eukprot:1109208-Prymnesium_polylepis.2